MSEKLLWKRLGKGISIEDALTLPKSKGGTGSKMKCTMETILA